MVLKTLPKTDYSSTPSICRALHESDCALATSNQCQANNVQNVLRNTIQSRGGCGPRSPSSSVPSSPNSKTVKISSQLATPQSANIERRQAVPLVPPSLPPPTLPSCLANVAQHSSGLDGIWQTTFHFIKISTRLGLFRCWNFSQCRLLFLAICLFANCLPVMLILFVGQADLIRFHFSPSLIPPPPWGCLFMAINIIFVSGFSEFSELRIKNFKFVRA